MEDHPKQQPDNTPQPDETASLPSPADPSAPQPDETILLPQPAAAPSISPSGETLSLPPSTAASPAPQTDETVVRLTPPAEQFQPDETLLLSPQAETASAPQTDETVVRLTPRAEQFQPDETLLLSPQAETASVSQTDETIRLTPRAEQFQPDETLLLSLPAESSQTDETILLAPSAELTQSAEQLPPTGPVGEEPPSQYAAYAFAETVPGVPVMAPGAVPAPNTPFPPPPPGYPFTPLPPPVYPGVPQSSPGYPSMFPVQPNQPAFVPQVTKPATSAKTRRRRILIVVILGLVILGGIVGTIIVTLPPRPSISVSSSYHGSGGLGGPADTVLSVTGTGFSHNSMITFLLDDAPAPGAPSMQSDDSGNFHADVTITDNWLIKTHTFSAKDAKGYKAQPVLQITVIPLPLLQVTSKYTQNSTLAGASGTAFTLAGRRFSPNSSISLLLDNQPLPGDTLIQSDQTGRFQEDITVTSAWTLGEHTLSARDDKGYSTQQSQALVIVPPGVADTPGPNGSPANDATFMAYISGSATETSGYRYSIYWSLNITGRPDPQGGTVCASWDDGSQRTYKGTLRGSNLGYTEKITYSCRGSYKNGHFTYTETATSDTFNLSDGEYCASPGSYIAAQISGTFTSSTNIKGTYHRDYFQANCNGNLAYIFRYPADGSWSGYMV